jgi:hypothetical protein
VNLPQLVEPLGDPSLREVLDGLYRSKFFRQRPKATDQMLEALWGVVHAKSRPLELFFLWGVHGKPGTDGDDGQAMSYLSRFLEHLSVALGAPAAMTIVACDTHADVNLVTGTGRDRYVAGIRGLAGEYGWNTIRMSEIWRAHGITLEHVAELANKPEVIALSSQLVPFARRYYRGNHPEDGAAQYLAARMLEKPALEKRFRGFIHVTPINPALHYLQPDLPEFYVWLARRGGSVKPWFPKEHS